MPLHPVPGSEKFDNQDTATEAELRGAAEAAGLALHTVSDQAIADVDPLTYEVIRHRLWAITEEMGEAIKRMSGSVVVTDCNDFDSVICDEIGDEVQVGLYNLHLAATTDLAIRWTFEHRAANPGIAEGDMWLCNDPWVGGGGHQNDVAVYAPLFWEGELFAWTCAVAHQVDLGGASPGSWSVKSRDIFSESLPIPPVKMVEGGVIRSDMEDMYLRRSRVPKLVALDLRAKIGANNIGHEQLRKLIAKYGPERVKAVMKRTANDAETRLRAKLRALPDGTWRTVAHQDHAHEGDRSVYRIVLTMTKRDDRLTFDFTGTDGEAEGLINCSYGGARAGVLVAVMPLLCGDIPWAPGGIARCIEIISEPGTLNNCSFPAGLSKAPVAATWSTTNAAIETISGMLDTTPRFRDHAISVCSGTWPLTLIAGVDQRENPFVTMLCDAMSGGMGAKVDGDGVDTGGVFNIPMGRMADVEMNEFVFPLLYLWRREERDSGGPGRYRGGLGGSSCFVAHDTSARGMHMVVSSTGKAVPQSSGLAGGYPGNTVHEVILRESDVREMLSKGQIPTELAQLACSEEVLQPHVETDLGWNDVFSVQWEAGSGYGDPLLRDAHAIAHDLAEEKLSRDAAEEVYGAVFHDNGRIDEMATDRRRGEMRKQRAGVVGFEVAS
jgi:N-methylhydantoinase B